MLYHSIQHLPMTWILSQPNHLYIFPHQEPASLHKSTRPSPAVPTIHSYIYPNLSLEPPLALSSPHTIPPSAHISCRRRGALAKEEAEEERKVPSIAIGLARRARAGPDSDTFSLPLRRVRAKKLGLFDPSLFTSYTRALENTFDFFL